MIYNQTFNFRLFFNISYSDYGAFRNPILPNPTRRAPSLALPTRLRVPRLKVEEGEQTIHPGDCPWPALPSQGLGCNNWAQAPTCPPACAHIHIIYGSSLSWSIPGRAPTQQHRVGQGRRARQSWAGEDPEKEGGPGYRTKGGEKVGPHHVHLPVSGNSQVPYSWGH